MAQDFGYARRIGKRVAWLGALAGLALLPSMAIADKVGNRVAGTSLGVGPADPAVELVGRTMSATIPSDQRGDSPAMTLAQATTGPGTCFQPGARVEWDFQYNFYDEATICTYRGNRFISSAAGMGRVTGIAKGRSYQDFEHDRRCYDNTRVDFSSRGRRESWYGKLCESRFRQPGEDSPQGMPESCSVQGAVITYWWNCYGPGCEQPSAVCTIRGVQYLQAVRTMHLVTKFLLGPNFAEGCYHSSELAVDNKQAHLGVLCPH